jgi:Cu-Zn family superoxide dismutase
MHLVGPTGIIGHGLIVHAKADDLKTQPTGDAGGRVACAAIGIAGPKKAPPK